MRRFFLGLTALLLVLLMSAPLLLGCSDNRNSSSQSETDVIQQDGDLSKRNNLPKLNFKDENFTILVRYSNRSADSEEMTGDSINDAFYIRNRKVEQDLGVKINSESFSQDGDELREAVLAGEQRYNVVQEDMPTMATYVKEGLFYCDDFIDYLDLDQPYWSQGVIDSLTVCGKRYFFAGDISIYENRNLWCIFYNKELADNLQLGDLYELRDNGTWTLDKFLELASKGAADLDGNGRWSFKVDQFATINMQEAYSGMYNAMGQCTVVRDSDGHMVVNIDSESSVNTYQRLSDYAAAGYGKQFLTVDRVQTEDKWGDQYNVFHTGRGLFLHGTAHNVEGEEMRNMEQEYGMMPIPKADEKQSDYISSSQEWGFCVYGVPVCTPNMPLTGAVLECLCDYSTDTIRYACYDQALYRKYSRDVDATVTLDILFDNIIVDPGFVFVRYKDTPLRNVLREGILKNKVASTIEANKRLIVNAINEYEEAIEKLDH